MAKLGDGTLPLSATNTHTGGTNISVDRRVFKNTDSVSMNCYIFIVSGEIFPTLTVMNDAVAPELPQSKTSRLAVASLALGIFSPWLCLIVSGIPAVICGHVALRKIKRSGGTLTGSGLAIAGLVLGYLSFFTTLIIIVIGTLTRLAIPEVTSVLDKAKLEESQRHAREIVQACRVYADAHGGQFPDSLKVLVEQQLLDEQYLSSPLAKDRDEYGYVYVPGYDTSTDGHRVLVYDRNVVKIGEHDYYVLGYANGTAVVEKVADVASVVDKIEQDEIAEETPRR